MPRTIEEVTYEAVRWELGQYQENMSSFPVGARVDIQQTVQIDWDSSAKTRGVQGRLTLRYVDRNTNKVALRIVLTGHFVVDRMGQDALHGDMVGLPREVWLAMAREVYDTARGLVLAKLKKLGASGIPTVPDEAFSIGEAPDDLGLSFN
jgi:hypothetical protein